MKSLLNIVFSILTIGCCTCPPKTNVTPMPNITPVKQSNERLKTKVKTIQDTNQESIKTNKSIGEDIDSADNELKKLLNNGR